MSVTFIQHKAKITVSSIKEVSIQHKDNKTVKLELRKAVPDPKPPAHHVVSRFKIHSV